MTDPKPPPHPPVQARHPGRPRPAPQAQVLHEAAMRRPNEKLHLATHCLGGMKHRHERKPTDPHPNPPPQAGEGEESSEPSA